MAQTGSDGLFRVGGLLMRFGLRKYAGSGAPVNGASSVGAGFVAPGSEYTDSVSGVKWINVGTKALPVWSPLNPVSVAITSASLLAMFGAAVNLIAAPPAGYMLLVDNVIFVMTRTATAYASGGAITFQYTAGVSVTTGTIPATVLTTAGAAITQTQLGPITGANGTVVPVATGIEITNATGAFTTGTGTAKVVFDYRIVKQ